jgi:hypothetical protein
MRRYVLLAVVASAFIAVSILLYLLHFSIFQDPHHIFIFLLSDLAFLPLEVFLVVIVIERIIARREKQAMMNKLNMVIGAFFSEVGNQLLLNMVHCLEKCEELYKELLFDSNWTHKNFTRAISFAPMIVERSDYNHIDLEELKAFLIEKRTFLLALLENPNLLEHDRFTDLLWATFHLSEELEARQTMDDLPATDLVHIKNDIRRVYQYLLIEWIYHAEHLQSNYPFLFSLVVRTNPFKEQASPIITE